MTHHEYPSAAFPRLPRIAVTAPESWQPRVVADAVMALVKERGDGVFATNIVATITREDARGAADLDATTAAAIADLVDVQMIDHTVVTWGEREWTVDQYAFIPEEWSTLVQLIVRTVVRHGEAWDVVRLTATVDATLAETDFADITAVLQSAIVDIDD